MLSDDCIFQTRMFCPKASHSWEELITEVARRILACTHMHFYFTNERVRGMAVIRTCDLNSSACMQTPIAFLLHHDASNFLFLKKCYCFGPYNANFMCQLG